MDRYDPDHERSIFKRPFEDEDEDAGIAAPRAPAAAGPRLPGRIDSLPAGATQGSVAAPPGDAQPSGNRRLFAVAAPGILIMLLIGLWIGSSRNSAEPATANVSPTPTESAAAAAPVTATPTPAPEPPEPTATQSPVAVPSATPVPTAVPTPAGPPAELAVNAWARVSTGELNVRGAPGVGSQAVYRLVRGAVTFVFDGPVSADGLSWYRVASLGGTRGWIASGPADSPFARTFATDAILIQCDRVTTEVLRIVDGSVRAVDPIGIGDLAVPAAAFDAFELGALELVRATRDDACFTARVAMDESLTVDADFGGAACGRPVWDANVFRLQPAAGQNVVIEDQVKQTAIVHPALLQSRGESDPLSVNMRATIGLLAASEAAGCVHAYTSDDPPHRYQAVDGTACVIMVERTDDSVMLKAASSGDVFRLVRTPSWSVAQFSVGGSGTPMYLHASASPGERHTYIGPDSLKGC